MSGPRPIWRAIVWIERFLPVPAPSLSETGRTQARWRFAILPIVVLSVALPNLVRNRSDIGGMWPQYRVLTEQFVLLLAFVVAVAAIISGIVTWHKNHA